MHRFHTSLHLSSSRQERKSHCITSSFHPHAMVPALTVQRVLGTMASMTSVVQYIRLEISSVVVSRPLRPAHRPSSHSFKSHPRTRLPISVVAFSSQPIRQAAIPTTTTTNTGHHQHQPHSLRSSLQISQNLHQVVFQREIASHQRIRTVGGYKSLQSFQKSPRWQDGTN